MLETALPGGVKKPLDHISCPAPDVCSGGLQPVTVCEAGCAALLGSRPDTYVQRARRIRAELGKIPVALFPDIISPALLSFRFACGCR